MIDIIIEIKRDHEIQFCESRGKMVDGLIEAMAQSQFGKIRREIINGLIKSIFEGNLSNGAGQFVEWLIEFILKD